MPTPPLVILDTGHGQKPDRFDPGATKGAIREVDLATVYLDHAADLLRADGWTVHRMNAGAYSARHANARALVGSERALYVQGHVNAGGGTYGLVEHDTRSQAGAAAARFLAAQLLDLTNVGRGKTVGLAEGERGWTCIQGIYAAPRMCGVIYEPGFIDHEAHAHLWTEEGLARIGAALAAGVKAWWKGQSSRDPTLGGGRPLTRGP